MCTDTATKHLTKVRQRAIKAQHSSLHVINQNLIPLAREKRPRPIKLFVQPSLFISSKIGQGSKKKQAHLEHVLCTKEMSKRGCRGSIEVIPLPPVDPLSPPPIMKLVNCTTTVMMMAA